MDEVVERGRYLRRIGFMCSAVSSNDLLRKEQASISASTAKRQLQFKPKRPQWPILKALSSESVVRGPVYLLIDQ
jgi:hypothetical protein